MTAFLAYSLGGGNSLVWSWFFWVHVHPVASVLWFVLCLFALLISIEVRQLDHFELHQPRKAIKPHYPLPKKLPHSPYRRSLAVTNTYQTAFKATEVSQDVVEVQDIIEVIASPPPQLPSPQVRKKRQTQLAQIALAQLPERID